MSTDRKAFKRFMSQVIAPGALMSGRHKIDVTRLDDIEPAILKALDNVVNSWLAWLEAAPRAAEDSVAAMADYIKAERPKR